MTPAQKAVETRQRNKEKRAQKALDEIKGCLSVLDDESSSVDQKLEASKILNEVRKGVRS